MLFIFCRHFVSIVIYSVIGLLKYCQTYSQSRYQSIALTKGIFALVSDHPKKHNVATLKSLVLNKNIRDRCCSRFLVYVVLHLVYNNELSPATSFINLSVFCLPHVGEIYCNLD